MENLLAHLSVLANKKLQFNYPSNLHEMVANSKDHGSTNSFRSEP